MTTIKNIINIVDQWAPPAYAEDFDNVGLLVGDPSGECSGILVSLDCIEGVVDEAITEKCNLIICFHPIIFSGLKKITGKDYVERVVLKAIRHDIAIFALHTRLDNHPEGVNKVLIEKLGVSNSKVLIPKPSGIKKLNTYVPKEHSGKVLESLHKAGAGALGNYSDCSFTLEGRGQFKGNEASTPHLGKPLEKINVDETQIQVVFESHLSPLVEKALLTSHPYENVAFEIYSLDNTLPSIGMGRIGSLKQSMDEEMFLNLIKTKLNPKGIRHSPLIGRKIQTIAVLGGSGSFAISQAKQQKADAFITADLKYHQFYQGETEVLLIDVGHYESEQFTKNLIFDYLIKKMPNFAIVLSRTKTNPVNYF
ncbi:MAG: Nif3-like dinuclear metal center hexameric protein [Flavobacteriaceae bacterium]|jgi:dinuclear metal center YbgI/SA1388 family protein|nr:Nif3-like dinuclear metal center hexameric protein [Flavobacteriaceae bacterium]